MTEHFHDDAGPEEPTRSVDEVSNRRTHFLHELLRVVSRHPDDQAFRLLLSGGAYRAMTAESGVDNMGMDELRQCLSDKESRTHDGLPAPRRIPSDDLHRISRQTERQHLALLFLESDAPECQALSRALWTPSSEHDSFDQMAQQYRTNRTETRRLLLDAMTQAHMNVLDALSAQESEKRVAPAAYDSAEQDPLRTHIRWMIRRDMPEILGIENSSFEFPWSEDDFICNLRQRNTIGMVADLNDSVVGYMIYELHKSHLMLLNLAVSPRVRGRGVGKRMIEMLKSKLSAQRRRSIGLLVRTGNKAAQAFFLKQGFFFRNILPQYFDNGEAAVLMHYQVGEEDRRDDLALLGKVFGEKAVAGFDTQAGETEFPSVDFFDAFLREAVRDDAFYHESLRRFRSWTMDQEVSLLSSIARQAWETVGSTKEVTNDEWMRYLKGREPADTPADSLRSLASVIDTDRHRVELEQLYAIENIEAQDAKEKAVIHEVFSAVMKYPYAHHDSQKKSEKKAFTVGTPRHLADERAVNCFTGPWLVAAMLLKCGIPYKRMFYCNATVPNANYFTGHASLLVRSRNNDLLVLDVGHRRIGQPLKTSFATSESMRQEFIDLLEGNRSESVILSIKEDRARHLNLPLRLQVMPALPGFASGLLLHTGLGLSHDRQAEAAGRAFELGLCFNEKDPHLRYQMGLYLFRKGDIALAKRYFEQALAVDPDCMYCHFSLGEAALQEGNVTEARQRFETYASEQRMAYGDREQMKKKAEKYLSLSDEELLTLWRTQSELTNKQRVVPLSSADTSLMPDGQGGQNAVG